MVVSVMCMCLPTRRSSDLGSRWCFGVPRCRPGSRPRTLAGVARPAPDHRVEHGSGTDADARGVHRQPTRCRIAPPGPARSEEHTSELQSLTNLVCRLLLEK